MPQVKPLAHANTKVRTPKLAVLPAEDLLLRAQRKSARRVLLVRVLTLARPQLAPVPLRQRRVVRYKSGSDGGGRRRLEDGQQMFSQLTVREWLENRIKEETIKGLRAAMQVDPANARVTAHLGRSLADQALKQGSNPDEARRARAEADFLTSRAVKLAPGNDEVKKPRDEVTNLLKTKVQDS